MVPLCRSLASKSTHRPSQSAVSVAQTSPRMPQAHLLHGGPICRPGAHQVHKMVRHARILQSGRCSVQRTCPHLRSRSFYLHHHCPLRRYGPAFYEIFGRSSRSCILFWGYVLELTITEHLWCCVYPFWSLPLFFIQAIHRFSQLLFFTWGNPRRWVM